MDLGATFLVIFVLTVDTAGFAQDRMRASQAQATKAEAFDYAAAGQAGPGVFD
jgi:hypothetical protein